MFQATLRVSSPASAALRAAIASLEPAATLLWQDNPALQRSYAVVQSEAPIQLQALSELAGVRVFEGPVIALAVWPRPPEALRELAEAFGGAGAPGGIAGCEPSGQALVLEFDIERTAVSLVLQTIDVELARFKGTRVSSVLTPLPPQWSTRIAAQGLGAPEIAPDRVLEALLKQYDGVG